MHVHWQRWGLRWLVLLALLGPRLWANDPADKSLAAYEQFKAEVEAKAQAMVDEFYKSQTEKVALLEHPFVKGTHIVLRLKQGREQAVAGEFKGVTPNADFALIGDRRIAMLDVVDIDRERVILGHNPELVPQRVNPLKEELAQSRKLKKEAFLQNLAEEAGYTAKFFQEHRALGDRFWSLQELGDRELELQVDWPAEAEFAKLTLNCNRVQLPSCAVLIFGKGAVGTTVPLTGENALKVADARWETVTFELFAKDLGQAPDRVITAEVKLLFLSQQLGAWYLIPRPAQRTTFKEGEAFKASYRFVMLPDSVLKPSKATEDDFTVLLGKAAAYQEQIAARKTEIEKRSIEAKQKEEEEKRKRLEELERQAKAKKARKEQWRIIREEYDWQLGEDVKPTAQTPIANFESRDVMDNVNAPRKFNKMPVMNYTSWETVDGVGVVNRERKFEVVSGQYRILQVKLPVKDEKDDPAVEKKPKKKPKKPAKPAAAGPGGPGGFGMMPGGPAGPGATGAAPAESKGAAGAAGATEGEEEEEEEEEAPACLFFIQYAVKVINNNQKEACKFTPLVAISFQERPEEETEKAKEDKFTIPPTLFETVLGAVLVPPEKLAYRVAEMRIEIRLD